METYLEFASLFPVGDHNLGRRRACEMSNYVNDIKGQMQ
jgi:hypothetical protein